MSEQRTEREAKEKAAFDKASVWMQSFLKSSVPKYGGMVPFVIDKYEATSWWDVGERNMVGIVVTDANDIPHAITTLYNHIVAELWDAGIKHDEEKDQSRQEALDKGYDHTGYSRHDNYLGFGLYPALIVPESLTPITNTLPEDFDVYVIAKSPMQKLEDEFIAQLEAIEAQKQDTD